jgi:hypothetical protein
MDHQAADEMSERTYTQPRRGARRPPGLPWSRRRAHHVDVPGMRPDGVRAAAQHPLHLSRRARDSPDIQRDGFDVTDEALSDEMVEAKWAEIAPLIDVMTTRIQTPGEFAVQPGSELAADDAASSPIKSRTPRVGASMQASITSTHSNRSSLTHVSSTPTLRTASCAVPLKTLQQGSGYSTPGNASFELNTDCAGG